MTRIDEKRDMARVSANKRWTNDERNANAMPTHSERNANAMQVKESKEKNIYVSAHADAHQNTQEDDTDFERFWTVYPRRVDKARAKKTWSSKVKQGCQPEDIIAGAQRYAKERNGQDPKYTKHPATYLNAKSWEDECTEEVDPYAKLPSYQ